MRVSTTWRETGLPGRWRDGYLSLSAHGGTGRQRSPWIQDELSGRRVEELLTGETPSASPDHFTAAPGTTGGGGVTATGGGERGCVCVCVCVSVFCVCVRALISVFAVCLLVRTTKAGH